MAKEAEKKAAGAVAIEVIYEYAKDTPGTWRYDAKVNKGERAPAGSVYLPKEVYKTKPADTVKGIFTFTTEK